MNWMRTVGLAGVVILMWCPGLLGQGVADYVIATETATAEGHRWKVRRFRCELLERSRETALNAVFTVLESRGYRGDEGPYRAMDSAVPFGWASVGGGDGGRDEHLADAMLGQAMVLHMDRQGSLSLRARSEGRVEGSPGAKVSDSGSRFLKAAGTDFTFMIMAGMPMTRRTAEREAGIALKLTKTRGKPVVQDAPYGHRIVVEPETAGGSSGVQLHYASGGALLGADMIIASPAELTLEAALAQGASLAPKHGHQRIRLRRIEADGLPWDVGREPVAASLAPPLDRQAPPVARSDAAPAVAPSPGYLVRPALRRRNAGAAPRPARPAPRADNRRLAVQIIDPEGPRKRLLSKGGVPLVFKGKGASSLDALRESLRVAANPHHFPFKGSDSRALSVIDGKPVFPSRKSLLITCDPRLPTAWVQRVLLLCSFIPGEDVRQKMADAPGGSPMIWDIHWQLEGEDQVLAMPLPTDGEVVDVDGPRPITLSIAPNGDSRWALSIKDGPKEFGGVITGWKAPAGAPLTISTQPSDLLSTLASMAELARENDKRTVFALESDPEVPFAVTFAVAQAMRDIQVPGNVLRLKGVSAALMK